MSDIPESIVRQCGACTACCTGWLQASVPDIVELEYGVACPHVTPDGCSIHKDRPDEPCRSFKCGWLLDLEIPTALRPDLSKAIIIPAKYQWEGLPVDVIAPVGDDVPQDTLATFMALSRQHQRPVLFRNSRIVDGVRKFGLLPYGPPQFERDIEAMVLAGDFD